MRRYHGGLLISAACAAVVACSGGSPIPGEPEQVDSPVEVTTTTTADETIGGTTTTRERTRTSESEPPGVPGSPIDYDSTVLLAGVEGARADILETLRETCGPGLCGVTIEVDGEGQCAARIGPDPVLPGGTITITAKPCETEETSTEESTSETTTSDTTESGG